MGFRGHPTIMTPTLDQVARDAAVFPNAYSMTPTCIPARRELYTGAEARTHGDRVFNETLRMSDLPTLAQTFRDAGYQAYAVGKMHVYPQRDRVGFDDVILHEECRHHLGLTADDYELFLAEQGYPGQAMTHAMCNNDYLTRPWHLPEHCHPTNWTASQMCKTIRRRDPTRPAFWYMSFAHPHPPLAPLAEYMDLYSESEIDMPFMGEWAQDIEALPYALRRRRISSNKYNEKAIRQGRRSFYALCTHIDHQIRLVIGMLREEGILGDTLIMLVGDHGDMLGNHGLWAKSNFHEYSTNIPMILSPHPSCERVERGVQDKRLACLCDVMPTLLDLCGIPIPDTVEGISLISDERRDYVYGEHTHGGGANRMIHDGRYKLIWYPAGNRIQLFDLENDPEELRDLSEDKDHAEIRERLTQLLIPRLYGEDLECVKDGKLVGRPEPEPGPGSARNLNGQRGWRYM